MTQTTVEMPSGIHRLRKAGHPLVGPVLVVLIGLSIFLYPAVATQWNNIKQMRVAAEYSKLEEAVAPEVINQALEDARYYNAHHTNGPILDPWLARVTPDNTEYHTYLEQLNQQPAMGRVIIPSQRIDLPIYHGTTPEALQRGAGHLFGSDLPVGGDSTRTVITGHSGLANATLFDNLKGVHAGDPIYIVAAGQKLKYVIDQLQVVLPTEPGNLRPVPGEDLLTLITCTPYGINTHRLLVTAHRVPLDEVKEQAAFETRGPAVQWWMWWVLAAGILVIIALVWWVVSMLRTYKKREQLRIPVEDLIPVTDFGIDLSAGPRTRRSAPDRKEHR
ncbi:class C sortase [Corynebacterium mendelii]|uniref:Class C sortase n=1 Tax=Corynebacterium mendelii TaxID=2765362 RepID=A0A939IUF3_9CORY|nr:class C sortase [Corynebacterium mendelii]MBN9643131.1 class C sortase [Corynebacterium mendelii]